MTPTELQRHALRTMHEEHVATLDRLARTAQAIRAPRSARDAAMPRFRELLRALLADLEGNVERHFLFEEQQLFPLLHAAGRAQLAEALLLEHAGIRRAVSTLLAHVRRTLAENPVEEEWLEFGRQANALIEAKRAHMQREESEMVPALRAILPPA